MPSSLYEISAPAVHHGSCIPHYKFEMAENDVPSAEYIFRHFEFVMLNTTTMTDALL